MTVTLGLDGSGKVDIVAGGYEDWQKQRKADQVKMMAKPSPKPTQTEEPPTPPPPRKGKLSYKDQRDYELLPQRIAEIDTAMAAHETALHDPALYTRDPGEFAKLTAALEALRAEKDAAEERWLGLAELAEG